MRWRPAFPAPVSGNLEEKLIGNPEVRRWLYSIGIALSALLAAIGIIDNNIVAPVNVLLAAVFGIALTNTSNDKEN